MSCRARNSTNVKQAALHFGDRKLLPETDSASGGELKHTNPRAWFGRDRRPERDSGLGDVLVPLSLPKKRARQTIAPRREMVGSLSIPPARWHRGEPSSVSWFCFLIVYSMLKQVAARFVVWPEKGTG